MSKKSILYIILLSIFCSSYIFAHDTQVIHPIITESALASTTLNNYFINNIGLNNGVKTQFPANSSKTVLYWLREGSKQEDSPMCRASNHFHDPTKPWTSAAMSDSPWWIDYLACRSYTPYHATVTWATGFTSLTSTPISYDPNNIKSPNVWGKARNNYYQALTATTQTDRETYFAQTFLALGQVLHLIQDMSVPAHVRNDFKSHLIFSGVLDKDGNVLLDPTQWFGNPFESYIKSNSQLVFATESAPPTFTNPRLTYFWDTDKYDGTNPSNSRTLGLAEITNANYFSNDTIPPNNPSEAHHFPYPRIDAENYNICEDYEMGTTSMRRYICRNNQPGSLAKITSISFLNEEQTIANANLSSLRLVLDDNVHNAYAKDLLPLAIGYSSQLLNYFFRGQMDVKCLPVIKENKISYVKLTIKNATLDEAMTNGKLMLTGKYTDSNNEEKIIKATYGASDYAVIGSLDYGQSLEGLNFLFPESTQIPVDQWDSIKLILAYQGKLGNEEGAVIGKVFNPGNLNFNEEFNTTPKGDYNWFQMDSPVFGSNVWDGAARNEIMGGKLIKTNARYPIANPSGPYPGAHFNLSLIGVHNLSGTTYANNIFPIPITENTYIEFKIDEMTISPHTTEGGNYTHYQGLVLSFNNGYKLELSLDDQFWYINNTTGYFNFSAGQTIVDNIYDMFQQWNLPMPTDLKLDSIGLYQQIGFDLPTNTQYEQKMIVDFIRIVEME